MTRVVGRNGLPVLPAPQDRAGFYLHPLMLSSSAGSQVRPAEAS